MTKTPFSLLKIAEGKKASFFAPIFRFVMSNPVGFLAGLSHNEYYVAKNFEPNATLTSRK